VVIGDPKTRFEEDPVRMLRALRFMAKLGFTISPKLAKLIKQNINLMRDVSNARMYDEIFKLFHHAHGVESWNKLREYGLIEILFHLKSKSLNQQEAQPGNVDAFIKTALENTDRRVGQGKPVIPAFFFAVILWHSYLLKRNNRNDLPKGRQATFIVADEIMLAQIPTIAIPKRVSGIVAEIWDMQQTLEQRRPNQILKVLENKRFRASYDFLLLRQKIGEASEEICQWWTKIQDVNEQTRLDLIEALPKPKGKNNRRRRKPNKNRANQTQTS
jgi:poly(A) polymerase